MAAVTIRGGAPTDVPALGRLGALLVRTHHDFDPQRFIAATSRTEKGYGSFLDGRAERIGAALFHSRRFRPTMIELTRELDD